MNGIFIKFNKLKNKEYRHAYLKEHIRVGIASQIRLIRNKSDINQSQLADIIGTKQSVISRLEDPDLGSVNLKTLLKVAEAFDVGLLVKFVSFGKFINESQDISPKNLAVSNYTEEFEYIKTQVDSVDNITASASTSLILGTSDWPKVDVSTILSESSYISGFDTLETFETEENIEDSQYMLIANYIASAPVYTAQLLK